MAFPITVERLEVTLIYRNKYCTESRGCRQVRLILLTADAQFRRQIK